MVKEHGPRSRWSQQPNISKKQQMVLPLFLSGHTIRVRGSIALPLWLGSTRTRPPRCHPHPGQHYANANPD
ncbi:hypothetical protein TNCV_2663721 [Trichonephila clavipes]|nr:hypothetical protein TNCV_2663721 [Trichonephila clavipes]